METILAHEKHKPRLKKFARVIRVFRGSFLVPVRLG